MLGRCGRVGRCWGTQVMYRVPIFSMTLRRRERRVGAMVKVMRVIRIRGWITKAMKRLRGISSGLRIGCHKIC
jgi:hypothetical protein